jgi:catalase
MRFTDNNTKNPDAYYEPNSFGGPIENKASEPPTLSLSGDAARYSQTSDRLDDDDFTQVRHLFNLFDNAARTRLYSNIAAAMQGVPDNIVDRQLNLFNTIDIAYGAGVKAALDN